MWVLCLEITVNKDHSLRGSVIYSACYLRSRLRLPLRTVQHTYVLYGRPIRGQKSKMSIRDSHIPLGFRLRHDDEDVNHRRFVNRDRLRSTDFGGAGGRGECPVAAHHASERVCCLPARYFECWYYCRLRRSASYWHGEHASERSYCATRGC